MCFVAAAVCSLHILLATENDQNVQLFARWLQLAQHSAAECRGVRWLSMLPPL